jgi:chromosome condensin MukBEF ATPase and DNA-binding subunit MukB
MRKVVEHCIAPMVEKRLIELGAILEEATMSVKDAEDRLKTAQAKQSTAREEMDGLVAWLGAEQIARPEPELAVRR